MDIFEQRRVKGSRWLCCLLLLLIHWTSSGAYAASNRMPSGVAISPSIYSDIYIVTSDRDIVCKTVPNTSGVTFSPGDTILISRESNGYIRKMAIDGIEKDKDYYIAVVSFSPPKFAFVSCEDVAWSELQTAEKERENAELSKITGIITGEQKFPLHPIYTYIGIIIVVILAAGVYGEAEDKMSAGSDKAGLLTVVAASMLTLAFVFQFWLFYDGNVALTKMIKGDANNPIFTMLRLFGTGFFIMFLFTIFEICLMYKVMRLTGVVFGGRKAFTLTGTIIWTGAVIAAVVIYFFYTDRLSIFGTVVCALLALDLIATMSINLKSPASLIITTVLYVTGCLSLGLTMVYGTLLTSWLIVAIIAASLLYMFFHFPQIVGYIRNGFGEIIGEIYSTGKGYIYGKGWLSSSEVDRLRRW